MKEIYSVDGTVNRGFVGQITYMVCLEKSYEKLDIHFRFDEDKRTYAPEDITEQLMSDTRELILRDYGISYSDEELRQSILTRMKTEIHTLATLNEEFIGCVHKQLVDRHMIYDGDYASDGCIPQSKIEGVLKVTVLVFNVLKDNTRYTLTVSAE